MLVMLLATLLTPFVGSLNLYFQDWLLRQTTRMSLPENFALVTIDERSLSLSGVDPEEVEKSGPLQLMDAGFPWSREVYAALTEKLMAAGARLVIFDILFPSSRDGDDSFADVLKAHPGKIVLASTFENPDSEHRGAGAPQLVPPNPKLREAVNENWGAVNLPAWADSKVRSVYASVTASDAMGIERVPHEDAFPSLAAVAARSLGVEPAEKSAGALSLFAARIDARHLAVRAVSCLRFGSATMPMARFSRTALFWSDRPPNACTTLT